MRHRALAVPSEEEYDVTVYAESADAAAEAAAGIASCNG